MNKMEKSCETCEFFMPDGKGGMVCADKYYGKKAPVENVNINECWSESFLSFMYNEEND